MWKKEEGLKDIDDVGDGKNAVDGKPRRIHVALVGKGRRESEDDMKLGLAPNLLTFR